MSPFAAVVLAGGRSTRFGNDDKLAATVHGRPMLTTVLDAAASAGARPVVVMGPPRPALVPAAGAAVTRFVPDPEPAGGGPAAAAAAGVHALGEAPRPIVVLLAGDLPFLTGTAVTQLVAALRGAPLSTAGAVPVDAEGRRQWLCSAWRTELLTARLQVVDALEGGSLHRLLAALPAVGWAPSAEGSGRLPWQDCDTPAELAAARRLAE